jgi:regulation of enolase protein 1 (concanavalin A-like superfamily)
MVKTTFGSGILKCPAWILVSGLMGLFSVSRLAAAPVPPTDNTSAPYMGTYGWSPSATGSSGVDRNQFMANWLYRSGLWIEDFTATNTWDNIACPSWMTNPVKLWLAKNPGGMYVVTIGMFPSGSTFTAGASGAYNSYFQTAANRLVAQGLANNTIIRLGHEFNGGWYAWHVSHKNTDVDSSGNKYDDRPENYVAYWRQIVTTMRAIAPNLKFCWNGAGAWTSYPVSDAYPGDAYVDYVATDVYDQSWAANTYPYPADATEAQKLTCQQNAWNNWIYPTSQNGILTWKNIAVAHGKPFAIPEWGIAARSDGHGGMDNPYFVQKMYDFIQDPANNVAFHIYFEVNAADGAHQLTSMPGRTATAFPNSAALFRKLFGLPFPQNNDIGTVGLAGSNDPVTVKGAGAGFLSGGTSDSFHFSSRTTSGDDVFVAQVTSMSPGAASQSGIMLRASTAANAAYAALALKNGQCLFQSRTTTGAAATQNYALSSVTAPIWLKLVRKGNAVTGYQSADGLNWNYAGSQTLTLTGTNYFGVAVSSGSTTALNATAIDNIDNLNIDKTLTASIANAIIVDNADATGVTKTGTWNTYTSPGGFYGSNYWWAYHGTGAATVKFTPTLPAAGQYDVYQCWSVDSARADNVLTTVNSANGATQLLSNQKVGSYQWNYMGTYTFNAGATGNVVISDASADDYGVCADAVMFVPVPVPSLPAPKVDADIGSPGMAGSATYSSGVYTVKGAGTGINSAGTSDQFNFVSQSLSGDQTLIARVTGLTYTAYNAKAGVMIRDTSAANSAFVMMDVSPGGWAEFYCRSATGGANAYVSVSSGVSPSASTPVWLKLVKSGSTFTGYYATTVGTPASADWHAVGSVSRSVSSYQAGLAVTSAVGSTLATATIDNASP